MSRLRSLVAPLALVALAASPAAADPLWPFPPPTDGFFTGNVRIARGEYLDHLLGYRIQAEMGRERATGIWAVRIRGVASYINTAEIYGFTLGAEDGAITMLTGSATSSVPAECRPAFESYNYVQEWRGAGALAVGDQFSPLVFRAAPDGACSAEMLRGLPSVEDAFAPLDFGSPTIASYIEIPSGGIDWGYTGARLGTQFVVTSAPEPSTIVLTGGGLFLVGFAARRRSDRGR